MNNEHSKKILVNALYLKWGVNGGTEVYLSSVLNHWYFHPNHTESIHITLLCTQSPHGGQGRNHILRLR